MTAQETVRRTNRWRGLLGAAFVAGALGLLARRPALLFAGAAIVALVAYARSVGPPRADLHVSRSLSDADPSPGDEVDVAVTVENAGERTIPQVSVTDGVPETLDVVDGAPSVGTALRPGASTTIRYTVEARPGTHEFEAGRVTVRDAVGVVERESTETTASEDTLATRDADPPPAPAVAPRSARASGTHSTAAGGTGVRFRGVREYERGDPLARIDWARRARTGDLATVEFHAERRAPVVLVVDGRRAAALAPGPGRRTARERGFEAAATLYESLVADGYRVGVATVGPRASWLPPGRGRVHEHRAEDHLTVPDDSDAPDDGKLDGGEADGGEADRGEADWTAWLRARLPADAVVLAVTPACDDEVSDALQRLCVAGHRVRVVSPDPTSADTAGRRLASIERDERLRTLRGTGASVVDWGPETPLTAALVDGRWTA